MLQKRLYNGFLGCCMMAAFQSCVTNAPVEPPKELTLGDSTISNTILVPVGGGIFYFNSADTANSARIIFPSNSYSSPKTISLKVTPITGSSFGDNVHPATALYTIDAGNDFSYKDIILNIPYDADTNNFSMGFFYDLITHELEGVPTIGYYPTLKPKLFSVTTRRSGNIFISKIPKSRLGTSASSSFDPTKDNWEFPNYGTAITSKGQFAGQTLTAAWYYYEQALKGNAHLYGAFDTDHGGESPKIWQDNNLGFRVAAETQNNLNWNNFALGMIAPLDNGNALLTFEQVLYSTLVTGKPQIITVMKDSTVLPLAVYGASNNTLLVADPDYPVNGSRKILTSGNNYKTGISMQALTQGESIFTNATYIGVRAMIDWDAIAKIWTNAENNIYTTFPPNIMNFKDVLGNLSPSLGGFVTLFNTVTLNIQGNQPSFIRVYQDGVFSLYDPAKGISLKQGSNHIGIYLQNLSTNGNDTLWTGYYSYNIQQQTFAILPALDSSFIENDVVLHAFMGQKTSQSLRYEWDMGDGSPAIKKTDTDSIKYRYQKTGIFTVTLSIYQVSTNSLIGKENSMVSVSLNPIFLSPTGINGIANIPYVFYGIINLPKDITQRCEWTMGDGSAMKSIIGFDTIPYAFQQAGTFTIKLNIFDNATNLLLGTGQQSISIQQMQLPTLAQLQASRFINIQFLGVHNYSPDGEGVLQYFFGGDFVWNFTVNFADANKTVWVNPTISSIDSFKYSYSHSETDYDPSTGRFIQSTSEGWNLEGLSIPLSDIHGDTLIYRVKGPSVKNYLSKISMSAEIIDRSGQGRADYLSTNWQDLITPPEIIIMFYK